MHELTGSANNGRAATLGSLDDLIQRGACQIIPQTIEAELATLLGQYDNVNTCGDKRAVAKGHLPGRAVVTPIAPGPAKVYNRSGFSSMLLGLK